MASNPPRRPVRNDPNLSRARAAAAPPRQRVARSARDSREQLLLFIAAGVVVLLVVGVLGFGWWHDHIYEPSRVIAQINGSSLTAGDLLNEMRLESTILRTSTNAAYASQGGPPPAAQQQLTQQLQQLPSQDYNELVTWALEAQEAAQVGVSVSPDQLSQQVAEDAAQIVAAQTPQPTPTLDVAAATATGVAAAQTATVSADLAASSTALAAAGLDTPTPTTTPTSSPTPLVTQTATATVTPSPTSTPLPTPLPTAEASILQTYLGVSEQQYSDLLQHDLVSKGLQSYFASSVPASQLEVHVRHIVLADQSTADQVLQQLQGGGDFAALAAQYSTDSSTKNNGGDMGWIPKGVQGSDFDNVVFALGAGQTSGVFSTAQGYQIAQVLEVDPNRAVDPSQLTQLQQNAYNTWLSGARQAANVNPVLDADISQWALTQLGIRSS